MSSANLPFETAWLAAGKTLDDGGTHAVARVEHAGVSYWVVAAASPVLTGVEPQNVSRQRLLLTLRAALARHIEQGESHTSLTISGLRILRIWQDKARLLGLGYIPEQSIAPASDRSRQKATPRTDIEIAEDWRREILREIQRLEAEIRADPASQVTLETLRQLYISVGDIEGANRTADALMQAKFRQ